MKFISKNAYLSDIVKYFPSLFIPGFVTTALVPIATRLFTQESYGNYVLAMAAINFANVAVSAWLGAAIMRFYARAEATGQIGELASTSSVIALGSAVVASLPPFGVAVIFHQRLTPELEQLLFWSPLFGIPLNLLTQPLQMLQAQRRIGAYNLLMTGRHILPMTAGLLLSVVMGRLIWGLLVGAALALWLMVPVAYQVCYRSAPVFSRRETSRPLARELFAFGLPLIPSLIMVQVLEISDRFIVGAWSGAADTAIYGAAYSLAATGMQLVTMPMTSAAAPLVVSVWERNGPIATQEFLVTVSRLFILIATPAFVGLSALAPLIMAVVTTPKYLAGAATIPFVAASGYLLGMQWLSQRGLLLAKKTSVLMLSYMVAGFLNIIANLCLVPTFGFQAAAWTTFGAYLVLFICIATAARRHLAWKMPLRCLFRSALASAAMLPALVVIPTRGLSLSAELLASISVGTLVYIAVLWLSGEWRDLLLHISRFPVLTNAGQTCEIRPP